MVSPLSMECGHCIFERLRNEGMWDRFGTTWQQELEAMCDKHLLETEQLYREHITSFYMPNLQKYVDDLVTERKRREVLNVPR